MLRKVYPEGHPSLAFALRGWGVTLLHLSRFRGAVAPLREALELHRRFKGPNSIDYAMTELDLSIALTRSESYDEAAALAREGRSILQGLLGDANSMVAYAGLPLGDALRGQKKFAEAESLLLAGYRRFEVPKPITKPWRSYAIGSLVRLYETWGRNEEAARYRALAAP